MNKKILVAAIAVATAAVGTSAMAATKLGGATQKGSLLIFPRIEAIGQSDVAGPFSDTYVSITNDSSTPVNLQCYWGTTEGNPFDAPGGNAGTAAGAGAARTAIRNNHYMDFNFTVTKNQPVSFWAGDLTRLANSATPSAVGLFLNNLSTVSNAPQFNFFQDGASSNAGELKCWAVDKTGTKEIHHNHLLGKAAVYTFEGENIAGGQAHEYNAWAFQANYWADPKKTYATNSISYTGKVLPTPGVISLDGKEYDQCPAALVGQFIPTFHSNLIPTRTTISVANCHQDMRQDAVSHITKLTYTVWNNNEVKYTGAHECMGAWYESDLGIDFGHFTYKTLKTDTAYFRAQPTASKLCNQDKAAGGHGQKGALDADVEVSAVVGVQVDDIGGYFQTSSNLVGLGAGTTYDNEAQGKGEILWDPNASADRGKN